MTSIDEDVLSFSQEALWFVNQLTPDNPLHNIPCWYSLRGPLDVDALRRALLDVVSRHEVLRSRMVDDDGSPRLVVDPPPGDWPLTAVEITGDVPELASLGAGEQWAADRPFDLAREHPIRAGLVKISDTEHLMLITVHHAAADAWSIDNVFLPELARRYVANLDDAPPPVEPLSRQYRHFASWQRQRLTGERRAELVDYWRRELANTPTVLELAGARRRPRQPSYRGADHHVTVPADVVAGLMALAKRGRTTLFATLLTAFAAVVAGSSTRDDVIVGVPMMDSGRFEFPETAGLFLNVVPVRIDLHGAPPAADLLRDVRNRLLGAFEHRDLPLEHIVGELGVERDLSRSPLVQMMFQLLDGEPGGTLTADTPFAEALDSRETTARYDLEGHFWQVDGGGLRGKFVYATDVYPAKVVAQVAERFEHALRALVADPAVPLAPLGAQDPEQELYSPELPSLGALIEQHSRTNPDDMAVVFGDHRLTYAQLNERANRYARLLIGEGVEGGQVVAVMMDRSAELVVVFLALMKIGAVYLPLAANDPARRIERLLDLSRSVRLVLSPGLSAPDGAAVPALTADRNLDLNHLPPHDLGVDIHPESVACVFYTSGSTGEPKGVADSHRALAIPTSSELWNDGRATSFVFHSRHSFDMSMYELLVPLLSGGRVVVAPPGPLQPSTLARLTEQEPVDAVFLTSGMFQVYAEENPASLKRLRTVWSGGDVALPSAFARVIEACPDTAVMNLYGPTEVSVTTTHRAQAPVDLGSSLPIGRPQAHLRCHVLDELQKKVTPGAVGELYISGPGLAQGYLNQPELTAARFLANPFGPPGDRMYRTGDLVRLRPDGELEFHGRADQQVKVRGFRIELTEIELALGQSSAVAHSAVVATGDGPGDKRLLAYVVSRDAAAPPSVEDLRRHLADLLPDYMLPAEIVFVSSLPLGPTGKVDRRNLPALPVPAASVRRLPSGPREEVVSAIFADVLGLPDIGPDDNFFDLGGDSLKATRVVSRIRRLLGVDLSVRSLFSEPSVARLTAELAGASRSAAPLRPALRPEVVPLSSAQQRLWFIHRSEGPNPTYNLPTALRLTGYVDHEALRHAVRDLVARHGTLRTRFPVHGGEPCQELLGVPGPEDALTVVEVDEAGLDAAVHAAARTTFDLTAEAPVRTWLFSTAPERHVLLILIHHIAADGSSMGPLLTDLGSLYDARRRGEEPDLPPLAVDYVDYTIWHRDLLGEEHDPASVGAVQSAYWQRVLAGLPEELVLPSDRGRPAIQSGAGGRATFELSADTHVKVRDLALRCQVSPFMVLQAAVAVLLGSLGGVDDVPIGGVIEGRAEDALANLVGFFVNTQVLRYDLAGDPTFEELLGKVRETNLAAFEHQHLPFERIVEIVNPVRSLSRHPLFQVMVLFNEDTEELSFADLRAEWVLPPGGTAKFDLNFMFYERPATAGVRGVLEFSADLFEPVTAQRFCGDLVQLIDALASRPGQRVTGVDPAGAAFYAALPARTETQWREVDDAEAGRVPRSPREELLCELMAQVLELDEVGIDDNFFELGGYSMLATRYIGRIRQVLGAELSIGAVFQAPTVAELAEVIGGGVDTDTMAVLMPIRPRGSRPPLFLMHPGIGLSWCYAGFATYLPEVPLYGLQARASRGEPRPADLAEMASDYVEHIREVQPHGPYRLAGWSFGGNVAHTMAAQLQAAGEEVEFLALLDAYPYGGERELEPDDVVLDLDEVRRDHLAGAAAAGLDDDVVARLAAVLVGNAALSRAHKPPVYSGDVVFFEAEGHDPAGECVPESWREFVSGSVSVHPVAATHFAMLEPEPLAEIARVLGSELKGVDHVDEV